MKLIASGRSGSKRRKNEMKQTIEVSQISENTYQNEPKMFKNSKTGWKTYVYDSCAFQVNSEWKSLTELLQMPNYKLDHPTKEKKTECFLPFLVTMYKDRLKFRSVGILGKQDKKNIDVPFELDEDLDVENENVTIFKTDVIIEDENKIRRSMEIAIDQVAMTYCVGE